MEVEVLSLGSRVSRYARHDDITHDAAERPRRSTRQQGIVIALAEALDLCGDVQVGGSR